MTVGRHGSAGGSWGRWTWSHRHLVIAGVVVLLVASVGLGLWWWRIVSATDPIDADPVRATVVVVSSPPCGTDAMTVVRYVGDDPAGTASLSGCGFAEGQRLAVEYRAGEPETVRKAGTATAGRPALPRRLLPIGILLAGFAAVVAAGTLMAGVRRRRRTGEPVLLADLQRRLGTARTAGDPASAEPDGPPIG